MVWISGKKGRLWHGGSCLVGRKRSSSSLFCNSACFSASQRYLTYQPHEWLPPITPHTGGTEGANPQCSPHQPPRRKIGEAQSPLLGEKKLQTGLPISESSNDLAGEEEDSDSPVSIPSARSSCEPHECSCYSVLAEVGPAPWGTLVKAPSSKRASLPNRPCTN